MVAGDSELACVEYWVFPVIGVPKRLALIQCPLRCRAVGNVGVIRVRHLQGLSRAEVEQCYITRVEVVFGYNCDGKGSETKTTMQTFFLYIYA